MVTLHQPYPIFHSLHYPEETVRVRSRHHATTARCTLASLAVLLIKMVGTLRNQQALVPQQ
jgi:hypothetical protein